MKRVFYFKCSDATYLKQEVESTTNSEGVTIRRTFKNNFEKALTQININLQSI